MATKQTQEGFIARCREVHGDKYDLSKVEYTGSYGTIEVVCRSHGSFFPRANNFINRRCGCPSCACDLAGKRSRKDPSVYLARFAEAHGDKFTYNGIFYKDSRAYIRVVCPEHGEFTQLVMDHGRGIGCPLCCKKVHDLSTFIHYANKVHGGKYDYSLSVYTRATTPLVIICPIHGEFKQRPTDHVDTGHGCQRCSKSGFNPSFPAEVYVYLLRGAKGCYVGFGVTNDFKKRNVTHERNASRGGFTLELVDKRYFDSGDDAWSTEKLMKSAVIIVDLGVEGFKTEAANESSLPEILRVLNAA